MKEVLSTVVEKLPDATLEQFGQRTARYVPPVVAIIDHQDPAAEEKGRLLDLYARRSALERSQGKDTSTPPESVERQSLVRVWDKSGAPAIPDRPRMETEAPDVSAYERIIGISDLLPLWYLNRGQRASKAIGVIRVNGERIGTGFLVGEQILLTNHHVLGHVARGLEEVEFGYAQREDDPDVVGPTTVFKLNRELCFLTSPKDALDFTLIGVDPVATNGQAIREFGFLRVDPEPGKISEGEAVGIIGHPDGKVQQVSLRDNRVLKIGFPEMEHYVWYTTDTLPGNSGSPVFNDQWQVVALHHAGVPDPCVLDDSRRGIWTERGCIPPDKVRDADQFKWIANEGIRISFIVDHCRQHNEQNGNPLVTRWLDDLRQGGTPYAGWRPKVPVPLEFAPEEGARNVPDTRRFAGRHGYDPDFLSEFKIDLPDIPDATQKQYGAVATLINDTQKSELQYTHSSIVMNAQRRLAYFTAVNIDGGKWRNLPRAKDRWAYDDRIRRDHQIGDELYRDEPGEHGWFDRGHLTRRQDPVWDSKTIAQQANDDTFVWTNCSPQYWLFNQSQEFWQGLENFILDNVARDQLSATVFSGPIFKVDDEKHRDIQIPTAYWKVVAVLDGNKRLHVSAYRVDQTQYAKNIPFERVPVGPYRGFQVSVAALAEETGLTFDQVLIEHDVWKEREPAELLEINQVQARHAPVKQDNAQ